MKTNCLDCYYGYAMRLYQFPPQFMPPCLFDDADYKDGNCKHFDCVVTDDERWEVVCADQQQKK